jgi:hypothetical protein
MNALEIRYAISKARRLYQRLCLQTKQLWRETLGIRVHPAAMQYVFYRVNMMAQVLKATLRHKSTEVFSSLNLKIAVICRIQGGAKF